VKLSRFLRPFRAAERTELAEQAVIRSCARTHTGRVRSVNEDRLLDRPEQALWAVADGMGGHSAGDVAAGIVIAHLAEQCGSGAKPGKADIVRALERANTTIRAHGQRSAAVSGSTVAALRIDNERFTLFWAGDSRIYRLGEAGLERLSHDHSVVQALVDSGAISPESARHHPQSNVITRALGTGEAVDIDTASGKISPGDVFLLCSDGLSGCVDDADIAAHLSLPVDIAADTLLAMALAAGGADNITLIIVTVPAAV
jgi:serine/threonine protein phosphatase PrpC